MMRKMVFSVKEYIPISFRDRYRHYWHKLRDVKTPLIVRRARWWLNKPPLPRLQNESVNLHLGCGDVNHPAFINIDLVPYKHVHYLRPIDDLSIFPDESVDLIYASHCLEHFSFRDVPAVLMEWGRVLKTGGVLRISVPDFDLILEIYEASGRSIENILLAVVGGQDYKFNFHYIIFNKDYLSRNLEQAGFSDVKTWETGSTDLTSFEDWSKEEFTIGNHKFPISLNLEAKK